MNVNMTQASSVSELLENARQLRINSLRMIHAAHSGHPGGSLSAADIVAALYFRVLRIDPQNPGWEERDRFIMSKGHACPVWYSALAMRGYFDMKHLGRLRQLNGILQGHPDMCKTPGIDYTAGSLGHGLAIGVGMALGARVRNLGFRVFVMLGDGDLNEGSTWESIMCANKYRLAGLTAIFDSNRLQIDGTTEQVMPNGKMKEKFSAFGWEVVEIDGHDMDAIVEVLEREAGDGPRLILANTIKGKGVSYMEDVCGWHGKAPSDEDLEIALTELGAAT
jgi:transketolase